jgi:hypothetical protein
LFLGEQIVCGVIDEKMIDATAAIELRLAASAASASDRRMLFAASEKIAAGTETLESLVAPRSPLAAALRDRLRGCLKLDRPLRQFHELLQIDQELDRPWKRFWGAMIYPVVVVLLMVLFAAINLSVSRAYRDASIVEAADKRKTNRDSADAAYDVTREKLVVWLLPYWACSMLIITWCVGDRAMRARWWSNWGLHFRTTIKVGVVFHRERSTSVDRY